MIKWYSCKEIIPDSSKDIVVLNTSVFNMSYYPACEIDLCDWSLEEHWTYASEFNFPSEVKGE